MAQGNFDACMAQTAKWEGGWSDHAADRGGKTNWGITQATLGRALGRPASAAEIRALTKEQAKAIYKRFFWDGIGADGMPRGVDLCCFDWGVNSGEARGRNAYANACSTKLSNPAEMVKAICASRRAFFSGIIARNPSQAVFRKGWFNRVAGIEAVAYKWALQAAGMMPADVSRKMQTEAATAGQKAKTKAGQAKAAGGGAVVAGPGATQAVGWDWAAIAFGGVCFGVLLFIAFLAWRAGAFERARKEAFQEIANV